MIFVNVKNKLKWSLLGGSWLLANSATTEWRATTPWVPESPMSSMQNLQSLMSSSADVIQEHMPPHLQTVMDSILQGVADEANEVTRSLGTVHAEYRKDCGTARVYVRICKCIDAQPHLTHDYDSNAARRWCLLMMLRSWCPVAISWCEPRFHALTVAEVGGHCVENATYAFTPKRSGLWSDESEPCVCVKAVSRSITKLWDLWAWLCTWNPNSPIAVGGMEPNPEWFKTSIYILMFYPTYKVGPYTSWVVVSNILYFHPYLGKWSNLTNIFQMGWNHQLVYIYIYI